MFIKTRETHSRSFLKAVSWRITGSLDTFGLSWLITGSLVFAGSIASTEVITKIVLYYLHERAWGAIPYGRQAKAAGSQAKAAGSLAQPMHSTN